MTNLHFIKRNVYLRSWENLSWSCSVAVAVVTCTGLWLLSVEDAKRAVRLTALNIISAKLILYLACKSILPELATNPCV